MKFKRWNEDQTIPSSMPILNTYLNKYKGKKPFKDFTILMIQHQLGNQVPQTLALIELGLDPTKIFWLDIPYTSSKKVREYLIQNSGIPAENFFTSDYNILQPYANYQRKRAQEILSLLLKNPPKHLIVLDDGAYFIEAMVTFKQKLPMVTIVEQTTRGIIKIENNASLKHFTQDLTLVNVAQSKPKTTLEPPFIGHSICKSLIRKLGVGFVNKDKKCLILGYGAIGKSVAESMREIGYSQIYVYDKKASNLKKAVENHYIKWNREKDIQFDLVVGCSGTCSFGIGDYVYLNDGAILASASSGSVELSREDFIELAISNESDDIILKTKGLRKKNIHSDLQFQLVDREVTFLNGGFPINFDGRTNCVPSHYIQPTNVMMVEAARISTQISKKGRYKFSSSFCKWLREEFEKELGEESTLIDSTTHLRKT
ncbi:MAG: hypothetical protein WCI53_11770 [Bacteroidota bacterium]|jgi:S-adenosylhomocysteine hydrolase